MGAPRNRRRNGFDYVHSWSTTTPGWPTPRSSPTRRARPAPASCSRAAAYFATHGITADRGGHHRQPPELQALHDFRDVVAALGAKHLFIKPHCPWQNGKVERFNRTLPIEWAYRQVFTTNARPHRSPCALARALQHSPPPQRTRGPPTRQPAYQPDGRVHLDVEPEFDHVPIGCSDSSRQWLSVRPTVHGTGQVRMLRQSTAPRGRLSHPRTP